MKCPHCLESFFENWKYDQIQTTKTHYWGVSNTVCPACNQPTVRLIIQKNSGGTPDSIVVYPSGNSRPPLPSEVTERYSKPYIQSSKVLQISPEASAAISRRCLQDILREEGKVKHGNLADEIQQVIDSGNLPSELSASIDSIRHIGNFGAHPIKSTNTGEIVEVEAGEAEWLLDTLDDLFDHYLVKPARIKQKRDALNKKLQDAGKPPMK